MKIDAREMLRLCGFTDESEISNYAWMINQGLDDEEHRKKIETIITSLEEAINDFNILGTFDISKIRYATKIIDSLIMIKEQPTDEIIDDIENKQNNPDLVHYKYLLKEFPTLMKASCGLEKGSYIVTADPNIGKTAFLVQLCNDLLTSNDGDSIKVLFVSLDDDKDDIIKRLISNMSYLISHRIEESPTINATARFYDFYDEIEKKWKVNPKATELKKMALKLIKENIKSKRLIITDSNHTLNTLRSAIIDAGTENLVVLIDAVYHIKTNLTGNEKDDFISNGIKQIARDFKIPVFCVKELKKPDGDRKQIKMADMKGSGSWGYDASFVAGLTDSEGRIKMWIDKNKKSDYKSRAIYYNFIPAKNIYQELTED